MHEWGGSYGGASAGDGDSVKDMNCLCYIW